MNYVDDTPELGSFINPYPKRDSLKNDIKPDAKGKIIVIEGLDGSRKK